MREAVGDRAWLEAMLDAEAALARAQARAGVIPADAAESRGRGAAGSSASTSRSSAARRVRPGTPCPRWWRRRTREFFHHGATSQDIVDTRGDARRATRARADPRRARRRGGRVRGAGGGAPRHGHGRADADAAGGADDVRAEGRRLARRGARRARGDSRRCGSTRSWVARRARSPRWAQPGPRWCASSPPELGLGAPDLPWHAHRGRIAALGLRAGDRRGRVREDRARRRAADQTEVGEVRSGSGESSAMAHKRNPVEAIRTRACATV